MDAAFWHSNDVFVSSSAGLFDWAGEERMKLTFALCVLLLSGCTGHKCIDGVVYSRINPFADVWVVDGMWPGQCKEIKLKEKNT